LLSVKQITYSWSDNSHRYFRGIRNVTFDVGPGEIVGVIGKSGSGKSTLAKCISGHLEIQSGSIEWNNSPLPKPSEQLIPGHPEIALLNQEIQIMEYHTVFENLNDRMTGYDITYRRNKINRLLALTGLSSFAFQKAGTLSQGQKQRLSIARVLIIMPRLLVLDEPFNHLDYGWKSKLTEWILKEHEKKRFSVLWISHDYSEILKYTTRVICLHNGRKVAEGTPEELYFRKNSKSVAELFGPYIEWKSDNRTIYLRPVSFNVMEKPVKGSVPCFLEKKYFNGMVLELWYITRKGERFVIYSNPGEKIIRQGFLCIDERNNFFG